MISYQYYKNNYHGCSVSESEWPMIEARAAEQLAYYKRIYRVTAKQSVSFCQPDEVQIDSDVLHIEGNDGNVSISVPDAFAFAICAMADVIAAIAAAQAGAVSSASIGSVSVSYSTGAAMDLSPKGQSRELYNAARRYLNIYRG